jgi:phosphoribosylformylglycinamidine synthase I
MEDGFGGRTMKRDKIRVCILRVAGTNCDKETKTALQDVGMSAEVVHFRQLSTDQNLMEYNMLVVPGGFSHGDYVRAGAIWGKKLMATMGKDIRRFMDEGRPILGICNGFQVLVEAGLLPQSQGVSRFPEAALASNSPSGYNCRWIYLRLETSSTCIFTKRILKRTLRIPVAHAEGRFLFEGKNTDKQLEELINNRQLVFRYCHEDGEFAEGNFPVNPNGSLYDIAGICSPSGTVFGLMPHPERAYFGWQSPNWTMETEKEPPPYGDGKLLFESAAEYLEKKF